jgi:SMI1-KNR4 cell-wall
MLCVPASLTIPLRPNTAMGRVDRRYASRTEDMLELEFTEEFLEFLDRHNGGVPLTPNFRMGKNVKVIERFLCLVKDYKTRPLGELDIGVVWSQLEDRLGEFLQPFAAVFPGDFLCFDFSSSDNPSVVLWVHDRSDEDAPYTVKVAKNFRAFLGLLFDASSADQGPPKGRALGTAGPRRRRT